MKPLNLLPGSAVKYRDNVYEIVDILGLEEVLARNINSRKAEKLFIKDLESAVQSTSSITDLNKIKDDDWDEARRRFEIIRPFVDLQQGKRNAVDMQKAATDNKISLATLYRWLKTYSTTQRVSSLTQKSRSDKGEGRLDPKVEEILEKHIKDIYLQEEKATPEDVWEVVKAECLKLKLKAPHSNTVRNRIALISDQVKTEKREGKKAAKDKFQPTLGSFPGADYPLAVVQIDHTPMDVIVVSDDEYRQPIGRPNLTLSIDINTKVIPGYYIGMDPPSALSTGLCLTHAILPKNNWLAKHNITTSYPVYGKPRKIHTDNAKEFRGTMLGKACEEHSIGLEQRPKGEPQYGGHVERSFRTFMHKLHTVPGTTRSNVQDKGDYDAEGNACMTLKALEYWFAVFITEYYHHKPHRGNNGIPPIKKYEMGILGTGNQIGIGLPPKITDEFRFKMDFLPFENRTVQEYGIVFEKIYYFHDALRRWVHAEENGRARKFICRYDPRDLSNIYFYEPDTDSYLTVPYREATRPAISIWELREAKRKLIDEGYTDINEDLIFGAVLKMRDIVKDQQEKTKKARKQTARKKGWDQAHKYVHEKSTPTLPESSADTFSMEDDDLFDEPVLPFDDIEPAR